MYCGARPTAAPQVRSVLSIEDFLNASSSDKDAKAPAQKTHPAMGETLSDEEPKTPGGMLARLLGGMSWVFLFVAISIYRSCTD